MAIGVTNRVTLRFIPESTWGVTPGTGPYTFLRTTGESLAYAITKEASADLRGDTQVGYLVPTSAGVSGGFNFELSYQEYDLLLAAALGGVWQNWSANGLANTGTGKVNFSPNQMNFWQADGVTAATSGNWSTLIRGQWLRTRCGTGMVNNGRLFRVSRTVDPTFALLTIDPSTPVTFDATQRASVVIEANQLANGTLQPSFTVEVEHADIGQYRTYRGMTVNDFELDMTVGGKATGSFTFLGKNAVRTNSTGMPGSGTASKQYECISAAIGLSKMLESNADLTGTSVKSIKLSVKNNLRMQEALGSSLGCPALGEGEFIVTGSMDVYFADGSLVDKFLANNTSSLAFAISDSAVYDPTVTGSVGNGYAFTLPKVVYTGSKISAGSKNQDVMVNLTFQALADDTNSVAALRKTIFIDRFGASGVI